MAKSKGGVRLPQSHGGLVGSFSTTYRTKFEFSPKLVIYFSLAVVFVIWLMHNL